MNTGSSSLEVNLRLNSRWDANILSSGFFWSSRRKRSSPVCSSIMSFSSRMVLSFINDELVTFGQTYAKENGYRIDEMGILALYSRIDMMQREDHAVTVAEVKEIMDEAISHSQKANVKHLVKRVFGRSTDNSDHIILKEEDFFTAVLRVVLVCCAVVFFTAIPFTFYQRYLGILY